MAGIDNISVTLTLRADLNIIITMQAASDSKKRGCYSNNLYSIGNTSGFALDQCATVDKPYTYNRLISSKIS